MKVIVINESGYREALFALGLSFGITSELSFDEFVEGCPAYERMKSVASRLAGRDGGHNSFLELITVWIDVDAPRYWHSERDRYRLSTQYSESTMHTLKKRTLTQADFENPIDPRSLDVINTLIESGASIIELKDHLPEGFLQRRILVMSYKTLRNVILQRHDHRLPQWKFFITKVLKSVNHPELLPAGEEK